MPIAACMFQDLRELDLLSQYLPQGEGVYVEGYLYSLGGCKSAPTKKMPLHRDLHNRIMQQGSIILGNPFAGHEIEPWPSFVLTSYFGCKVPA